MASRRLKTTIYTLSEEAKVSPGTVSKALNNAPGVSAEVRERVRQLARDRNFRPRVIANRAPNICLVFPNSLSRGTHFFSYQHLIMEGVAGYAQEENLEFSLYTAEWAEMEQRDILREFTRRGIAGAVILGDPDQVHLYRQLEEGRFPYCSVLKAPVGFQQRLVNVDNARIGQRAARHLIELGHRRIAVLTPSSDNRSGLLRLAGYRTALEEAGLEYKEDLVKAHNDRECTDLMAAAAGVKDILERHSDVTAFFAMSHRLALGALHALREMGVSVPEQISVMGCDDYPESAYLNPPLTTIRIPNRELGYMAARQVHRLIRGLSEQRFERYINLGGELIVRESTAPRRNAPRRKLIVA